MMVEGLNDVMKEHIRKALAQNMRDDGRDLLEFRKIQVEYGVVSTAEGSARVKIGDTEVIAGVKMSIEKPYPDTPDEGTIMVGAELLPLSSPEFELGPPSIKAVEIARVTDRGIREAKAIDVSKLCIEEGEKVWSVSVDVCSICDAGNLQDATALATLAALQDCRLPEHDKEYKIDYKKKTKTALPLKSLPVTMTVIKSGDQYMVDPSATEEAVVDARLTITIDSDGRLCSLQKGGDEPLTAEDVDKMAEIAEEKCKELRKLLHPAKK